MSIDLHKLFSNRRIYLFIVFIRGGYRSGAGGGGGGMGGRLPSSGIQPLRTQRVPALVFFKQSIFGRPTKIFLNASLAPIYTNLEGERAPKSAKKNAKCPKTFVFFTCFFKNLPAAQNIWPKKRSFYCFRRARLENQSILVDLKKRSSKFLKFF